MVLAERFFMNGFFCGFEDDREHFYKNARFYPFQFSLKGIYKD